MRPTVEVNRSSLAKRVTVALALGLGLIPGVTNASSRNFGAHLSGDEEVPAVDTNAQGQVIIRVVDDGLSYKLIVANIDDVFAAHIHCAPAGVNGPVGVTLFAGDPVTVNGILAQATIAAPDPGNDCGWDDVDDVVEAIRDGDAYVNVHTLANEPGEIRGQLR